MSRRCLDRDNVHLKIRVNFFFCRYLVQQVDGEGDQQNGGEHGEEKKDDVGEDGGNDSGDGGEICSVFLFSLSLCVMF
jgi:hypothetical protein